MNSLSCGDHYDSVILATSCRFFSVRGWLEPVCWTLSKSLWSIIRFGSNPKVRSKDAKRKIIGLPSGKVTMHLISCLYLLKEKKMKKRTIRRSKCDRSASSCVSNVCGCSFEAANMIPFREWSDMHVHGLILFIAIIDYKYALNWLQKYIPVIHLFLTQAYGKRQK